MPYPQVSDKGPWGASEPEESEYSRRRRQRDLSDRWDAHEQERLDKEDRDL